MKDAALPDSLQLPDDTPGSMTSPAATDAAPKPKRRLQSLDALRGLDMLCIVGLDSLARILAQTFPEQASLQTFSEQFGHKAWEGFALYDLVFPLFVFIAGVSMAFSLLKKSGEPGAWWKTLLHLYKRAIVLILLGCLVNGALSWNPENMRFASVLGLIGISCAVSGTIILLVRKTAAVAAAALLILGGIAYLQFNFGDFTPEGSINAIIDRSWLPGILHGGGYDPEGLLCIVSAIALALLGYTTGAALKYKECTPLMRFGFIFLCGAALLSISLVTAEYYPIIKRIWTSTFVLAAGGIGMLLLALFYLVIDVWNLRAWSFPLKVIGMNALFAYILTSLIDFGTLNERIFSGCAELLEPDYAPLFFAASYIILLWLLLFGMYRQRIFVKA